MSNTKATTTLNRPPHLLIATTVFALLVPLLSIPGPPMATGHPWKVELAVSVAVFLIVLFSKSHLGLDSIGNFAASRVRVAGLASIYVFMLWSGVSAFWANARVSVIHHTSAWFLYALVFLTALMYFNKKRSIRYPVAALGVFSMIVLAVCLFDYLSIAEFKFAEGSIRIRYAKYAEILVMAAPLLIASACYARKTITRSSSAIAGMGAWIAVMLSLSKGAFIAGIAGFLVLFTGILLFSGKRFRKTTLSLAVLWVGMTFGLQILFAQYSDVPATAQYISGEADKTRQSSDFRVFTWRVGRSMAAANPVFGVGADNFGSAFNDARRNYFANHSNRTGGESIAEHHMVERAHSEPLQVYAELGIVGLILFLSIFSTFAIPLFDRLRKKGKLSPALIGATAGMCAFAVSSMVSSFSFRAMQNGVVFMLIFAVGFYELTKHHKREVDITDLEPPKIISFSKWLICALLLMSVIYHALVGASNFYVLFGQNEKNPERSRAYFKTAISLNPENGAAYFMSGTREFVEEYPSEALPHLEKSKRYGATATLNYYFTASSHLLNNDPENAVRVMSEAVEIYPQSVYARVHYSVLLKKIGRDAEARLQYSEAFRLNDRQAETWRLILTDNLLNATDAVRNRKDLDKPHELEPQNIINAIFFLSKLKKNAK